MNISRRFPSLLRHSISKTVHSHPAIRPYSTTKMSYRNPIIVPATKKHTATVIMVHGLGDSGDNWSRIGLQWHRREMFEEVKFVFPHANSIPITVVCACFPFAISGSSSYVRVLMELRMEDPECQVGSISPNHVTEYVPFPRFISVLMSIARVFGTAVIAGRSGDPELAEVHFLAYQRRDHRRHPVESGRDRRVLPRGRHVALQRRHIPAEARWCLLSQRISADVSKLAEG